MGGEAGVGAPIKPSCGETAGPVFDGATFSVENVVPSELFGAFYRLYAGEGVGSVYVRAVRMESDAVAEPYLVSVDRRAVVGLRDVACFCSAGAVYTSRVGAADVVYPADGEDVGV